MIGNGGFAVLAPGHLIICSYACTNEHDVNAAYSKVFATTQSALHRVAIARLNEAPSRCG
eukprot:scaffold124673_cov39-Tisochrysis_lutea.AAC.1